MNEATAVYNKNQTSVSRAFNNSSSKSIRTGAGQLLLGNRMTQETGCSWTFQFLGGVVGKTGRWQNLFFSPLLGNETNNLLPVKILQKDHYDIICRLSPKWK